MTTVYIVTSGSYSDYRIEQVFSTRRKAQAWIRLHKVGKYDYAIEPFEVDLADALSLIKRGMRPWTCSRTVRGINWLIDYGVRVRPAEYGAAETDPTVEVSDYVGHETETWVVTVLAPTAEKAMKIGADKIAQALAEREGIA